MNTHYMVDPEANNAGEAQQHLTYLKALMSELDKRLPELPPQYDGLVGNALINMALNKLVGSYGQQATANMLANMAEMMWSEVGPAAIPVVRN